MQRQILRYAALTFKVIRLTSSINDERNVSRQLRMSANESRNVTEKYTDLVSVSKNVVLTTMNIFILVNLTYINYLMELFFYFFWKHSVLDTICRAPKNLELAVGAQVILIKTIDSGSKLVNGTRGVVVRFTRKTEQPVVRFEHGVERVILPEVWTVHGGGGGGGGSGGGVVASRRQLPLDLAWSISVHKSQGMTLSQVSLNLSNTFEYGQGYVALSRVKSLNGLKIIGQVTKNTFVAHPKVLQFYDLIKKW